MSDSDPLVRMLAVAAVAILLAIAVTYMFSRFYVGPRLDRQPQLAFLLSAKLFVSTFNVAVLLALVATYVSIYRDIPNQFTLSLLLFCLALLLYALTSNPLVQIYLGFRGGTQLGLFTFLPDLFAGVAVVALLYQSYT
jgi:ABC-type amino acid transport system permease subunit